MRKLLLGFIISFAASFTTFSAYAEKSIGETKPRFDPDSSENLFSDLEYPIDSRRNREEGRVLIIVEVSEDGSPRKAELVRTSGYPRLDQAALNWYGVHGKYFPGAKNGKPRTDWATFSVTFKLTHLR